MKGTAAIALLLLMSTAHLTFAQGYGVFTDHADVGAPRIAGDVDYDAEAQEYLVSGAGYNVWFDRDEFHYVWRRLSGDFVLRTRASFAGEGVEPHRKLGWMVRSGLDANATHVSAAVHGDGLTSLQYRKSAGGETAEVRFAITRADVIQLSRTGNDFTMSVARFGETLVSEQVSDVVLGDEVFVGLFVSSHNEDILEQAVFRNTRIVIPAPDGFVPYSDYIGSNLEVMDVESGHRRIVHRSDASLQAPNWTPDGTALIYNSEGLLYRFDLQDRIPVAINTAFADRNNNDHVLSFDGRLIGISHHSAEHDGQSIIYTVPVEGGTPRRVTDRGPSYLHGWSPDGAHLVYTAERDGDYEVYRIPSEGGEEVRLTRSPGLDDGSEYAPDGRHIYFNSVRTGRMEIWRMDPDGGDQEQLTDDDLNNWFPHVSPDGRWVLFLSYGSDVDPGDHPFYRHVYLRLMPRDGGPARVVAYLYGGQGSINVPSWSPDSRSVAFVSNTDRMRP